MSIFICQKKLLQLLNVYNNFFIHYLHRIDLRKHIFEYIQYSFLNMKNKKITNRYKYRYNTLILQQINMVFLRYFMNTLNSILSHFTILEMLHLIQQHFQAPQVHKITNKIRGYIQNMDNHITTVHHHFQFLFLFKTM